MAFLSFSNKKTAKRFESLIEVDQWLHVPAKQGHGVCYKGNIVDITPEAAARYIRFGGNLIKAKAAEGEGAKVIHIKTEL